MLSSLSFWKPYEKRRFQALPDKYSPQPKVLSEQVTHIETQVIVTPDPWIEFLGILLLPSLPTLSESELEWKYLFTECWSTHAAELHSAAILEQLSTKEKYTIKCILILQATFLAECREKECLSKTFSLQCYFSENRDFCMRGSNMQVSICCLKWYNFLACVPNGCGCHHTSAYVLGTKRKNLWALI